MTSPVLTLTTFFPASDAWAEMADAGVRHAVIVDGKEIRGVVSDADLGGRKGGALRVGRAVKDLMQENPFVASPMMSLARAAQELRARRIGCIPVVQRGKLVGMVTRSDLLRALADDGPKNAR